MEPRAGLILIAVLSGGLPGAYGLKQLFAGGDAGGLGSGSALEQPGVVVR